MKRLLPFILTAVMLVLLFPVAVSASRFDDVDEGKWYTEAIEFCDMNGYMAGTSENLFERNGTLTRAMFVTVLASIEGINTNYYAYNPCFSDVALGKWYSGAIAWAYAKDLASGLGDGPFGYKDPVTREQIAVFMLSYARYINSYHGYPDGILVNAYDRADLSVYDDEDSIHGWAKDAVSWAVAVGLISGTSETTVDPRGLCTRAQAAVIIRNFVLNVNESCNHEWVEPTCTEYGYCANCFIFNKSLAPHDFADGACRNCPAHYDPAERCAHTWVKEACDEDSFCLRCGKTKNDATSHSFIADEESELFIVCTECGYYTCAEEHVWVDATCIEDGYCRICNDLGESALGHDLEDGICRTCGGEYSQVDRCFHVWQMPDCENDGFCLVCGKVGERSDGHEFETGECNICGKKEVVHIHEWIEADCTDPRYCSLCYVIDESHPALGHDFSDNLICNNCRRYSNPDFTPHQNAMYNIYNYGSPLEDGKKGFFRGDLFGVAHSTDLFVRSDVPSSIFSSSRTEESFTIFETTVTYTSFTECEFTEGMTKMPFTMEYTSSYGMTITAAGNLDKDTLEISYDSFDYEGGDLKDAESLAESSILAALYSADSLFEKNTLVSLTDYGFNLYS